MTLIKKHLPGDKPSGLPSSSSTASFWHSEPNVFLMGHRTTDTLPATADVVIVGSGITGAAAARYLAEDQRSQHLSIVMLEAREVCWGATGRNGGHCQPLLFERSPDVAAFEVSNVEAVKLYIDKHQIPCEWRTVVGCRTFWNRAHFEAAKADVDRLARADPSLARRIVVTDDEESFRQHRVRLSCQGMTLTQDAGQLWPYKYVTFMVEKLIKEGRLNVQTNTPVTKIEGQTLRTPRGNIVAKQIILATNGYTSYLLHDFQSLIVPVRCEMSALHPTSSRLPSSYGMVGFGGENPEHDDYLIQRPFYQVEGQQRGGHLMFGGGRPFATYDCVGESDDDVVDPGEAHYLRTMLPQMLEMPGDELKASHQWTGIKGFSRDNMPWVGRVREGLWMAAGYTGHGMPNATLCAKAVVSMLLGDEPQLLVRNGDLPAAYLITAERIVKAESLATVAQQDLAY